MSRPIKQGLDYFPLDVDMDEKTELIEAKHGIIGFGILIKLFQKIYKEGYYIKWNEESLLLFSKRINVDKNLVNAIIKDCFQYNLLDETLFNEQNILTSHGIQKRYLNAVDRRKVVELIKKYVIVNINEVNVNINWINDDNSTQSKVKESKVNLLRPSDEEKDINSNGYITPNLFNKFWTVYPRKDGKGKALTKWNSLCKQGNKRPTWVEIKKAILLQMKSERWQNPKFIPLPATWLNQTRWIDDPKEMKSFRRDEEIHKPIYDEHIKYVWDEKSQHYVHSVSGEIYIP
jgi:hypothetical protein